MTPLKTIGVIASIVLGIVGVTLLFKSFAIVPAGHRGIVLTWGAVTGNPLDEGFHFKNPISQKIIKMNVQIQKVEVGADAASKDLQSVNSTIALNYHVLPEKTGNLYRNVGRDYADRIISPAIQEAVKASTAKYTAEELITKREDVKDSIRTALRSRLEENDIAVDEFSIINFSFSTEFDHAIEAKQTAVQEALRAENDLKRIKIEADQRVTQAQAEAQAIKLQSDAANNENYVQLKALEVQLEAVKKWNGALPTQMIPGGSLPFINLTK